MRILYLDVDTLRPDHLGCYGYARNTSPNIDRVAAEGVRFDNCYTSDAPCLPARSALFSGMFGIHNGAVNHGGSRADMFNEGPERGFRTRRAEQGWIAQMRKAGYRTVSVSPFAERHSAWDFCAGWNEIYNYGKGGHERADEIQTYARDWVERNGASDNWFLHVHYWDPHTPYRAPEDFGEPFADVPLPPEADWISEEDIAAGSKAFGSHSPLDLGGFGPANSEKFPRIPGVIRNKADYKRWIDGYDTGILYMDRHFGELLDILEKQGVLEDTAIIISSDHGENQGELNIFGDHQTADQITSRIPMIIRWPGGRTGAIDVGLRYNLDLPPTLMDLCGRNAPPKWDGRSFAEALTGADAPGRDYLVLSQMAWACQRSVRWDRYILLRTYDPGMKDLPPVALFDLEADPHETRNLAEERPDLVTHGLALLEQWTTEQMATSDHAIDPLWQIMREGGPFHTRLALDRYCEYLRQTGREDRIAALDRIYRNRPAVQYRPLFP